MSEKRVKVEREVAEREIKVEREQILFNDIHVQGVLPEGTKEITENGNYDVYFFKNASVNVPQPEGEITITENGTYNVKDYETAKVALDVITLSDYFYEDQTIGSSILEAVKAIPPVIIPATKTNLAQLLQSSKMYNVKKVALVGETGLSLTNLQSLAQNNTVVEEIKLLNMNDSSVTSTAGYYFVFQGCSALKTIYLQGLTNPNHLSCLNIFAGCSALETLVIDSESVFYLSSTSGLSGGVSIYVPDALVDSYKAAQYWSAYASQIKPLSELPANTGV